MKAPTEEIEDLPPFQGFPREGIIFLRNLRRNNNRPWFTDHKQDYEEYVRLPMQSLIASLRPHLERFAPEVEVHPKCSMFRIYRDTRFSKDKTPYKTHAAAHFVVHGTSKGLPGCGYYLHIEPGECFVGAGIYMPDSRQRKSIYKELSTNGNTFLSIVTSKPFVRRFGTLQGERLTRMPRGFDEDDPMADWLKLKQFFAGASFPEKVCYNRSLLKKTVDHFEAASPLVRFLNSAAM